MTTEHARHVIQGLLTEASFRQKFKDSAQLVKWLELEALPTIQKCLDDVYKSGIEEGRPPAPRLNGPVMPTQRKPA